jgi:TM2 domain-containing membrane protein YozV
LSEKRKLPAFLLCLFFGIFGVHRYYVGKVATGLLQLFTVGGLGIWVLFDLLVILLGGFTDKEGKLITKWV